MKEDHDRKEGAPASSGQVRREHIEVETILAPQQELGLWAHHIDLQAMNDMLGKTEYMTC